MTAVKNAILLKEADPATSVTILYRDMQMYGVENEDMFRKSKEMGVRYVTYDPGQAARWTNGQVKVYHLRMGKEIAIPADLVVLSTPLIAQEDVGDISTMLKVPVNENGFFLEGHVKLKPLDFATDGVYLVRERPVPFYYKRGDFSGSWEQHPGPPVFCQRKRFSPAALSRISTRKPAADAWDVWRYAHMAQSTIWRIVAFAR